jgi:DNA-binding transcriptional LysR family regulator
MTAMLDIDQLRTFIAISDTGSFTKAAEVVNKTQSAVSMQMKRLEERLERPIFSRDGRASKLTEDGQRLLDYARRIVKLNVETLAAFSDAELSGRVRLGVPDDYADRYLPEIMARFSHSYPAVELTVICEPSVDLLERIDNNQIDLAIVTNCESKRASETFRRERLLWVTSHSDARAVPGGASQLNALRRLGARSVCSIRAPTPVRSQLPCSPVSPFLCCPSQVCVPACVCCHPPMASRTCQAAVLASYAMRMKVRRLPMRSRSTLSHRLITCLKRRRRSDVHYLRLNTHIPRKSAQPSRSIHRGIFRAAPRPV